MTEFYEHLLVRREELERDLTARDGMPKAPVREALSAIGDVLDLGPQWTDDPLVDFWESEARAGREVDMDMTLDQLERVPGYEWVTEWRKRG